METVTYVAGIDPGIVHTGVVHLAFDRRRHMMAVRPLAIAGCKAEDLPTALIGNNTHVFIEGYRPRSHYSRDNEMVAAVAQMHKELQGSAVLNNTGVKTVVTDELLKLMQVHSFNTVTHHQDIRSAARIALLGMMKDPELNELLADVVADKLLLSGHSQWDIQVIE